MYKDKGQPGGGGGGDGGVCSDSLRCDGCWGALRPPYTQSLGPVETGPNVFLLGKSCAAFLTVLDAGCALITSSIQCTVRHAVRGCNLYTWGEGVFLWVGMVNCMDHSAHDRLPRSARCLC